MIFINKASVDTDKVQATLSAPLDNYVQQLRYGLNDKLYVVGDLLPTSTDQWVQGMRFNGNGAVHIWDVEIRGVPVQSASEGGLQFTIEGQLLVTTLGAVTQYNAGWPLDSRGYACMSTTA